MIRSKRGFPVATQPPKDMEVQGEEVSRKEDDAASAKTQESSMDDAEVIFSILNCQQHIHLFIQDPFTLHNLGQAYKARLRNAHINTLWNFHQ